MNFLSDEVITVAAGQTKTLTRANIDGSGGGGARARTVVIANQNLGATTVGYRFGSVPSSGSYTYFPLIPGEKISIEGYDNLVSLQFILIGSVTAKLFCGYFD